MPRAPWNTERDFQPVVPEGMYILPHAAQIMNLGSAGIQKAHRNGLRIRYVGRNAYVRGSDLIKYVEENGRDQFFPEER